MNVLFVVLGSALLALLLMGMFGVIALDLGWKAAAGIFAGTVAIVAVVVTGAVLISVGITGSWSWQ